MTTATTATEDTIEPNDQITLTGSVEYNTSYPPADAKKGYVARITGRAAGAVKYAREFLGDSVDLLPGDEALYERQIGKKKGGYTRYYHVVLSHPQHGLIVSRDCEASLAKIAKLLDDGHAIEDIVEPTNIREGKQCMVFDAEVRSAAKTKQAAQAQTIDSAVDACYAALCNLPEREQKKVLTALRKRITT